MTAEFASFWETPRNIALLVVAVAVIAGVLGYQLGSRLGSAPPQPAPMIIQAAPRGVNPSPGAKIYR
jgi:hypothetical protein